jgi:hypothetical protein
MSSEDPGGAARVYDRRLLLGEKRNDLLTLDEVQRYGLDSFGNSDHVSVYGMKPAEWYARGVRLLGRTAVECTRDELADRIGRDVADAARSLLPAAPDIVIDPFAGSGNTLFWLQRHLAATNAVGFELENGVFELTRQNLGIVDSSIALHHVDYRAGLSSLGQRSDRPIVVFIAPPWGDALDEERGLDFRRTKPPVAEIVDSLAATFAGVPLLCAIQVYERLDPAALDDVAARFDRSELRIYDLDLPGRNHGILLGARATLLG